MQQIKAINAITCYFTSIFINKFINKIFIFTHSIRVARSVFHTEFKLCLYCITVMDIYTIVRCNDRTILYIGEALMFFKEYNLQTMKIKLKIKLLEYPIGRQGFVKR